MAVTDLYSVVRKRGRKKVHEGGERVGGNPTPIHLDLLVQEK